MLKLDHFVGSGKIMARAIGEAQTLKLLEQFGGQSFWISKEPKPTHSTSRKLGIEAHKALSENWPEREFELPMATHVHKNMRNDQIRQDAKSLSMREMVAKYTMTRAQIQTILRQTQTLEPNENDDQEKQLKLIGF